MEYIEGDHVHWPSGHRAPHLVQLGCQPPLLLLGALPPIRGTYCCSSNPWSLSETKTSLRINTYLLGLSFTDRGPMLRIFSFADFPLSRDRKSVSMSAKTRHHAASY